MPAGRVSAKYDDYLAQVILPEHDLASLSLQEPAHTQVSMSIVCNHLLTPLPLHNMTV